MSCQPDHLCMCNVDKLFPPLVPPPVDKNGKLDLCVHQNQMAQKIVTVMCVDNI